MRAGILLFAGLIVLISATILVEGGWFRGRSGSSRSSTSRSSRSSPSRSSWGRSSRSSPSRSSWGRSSRSSPSRSSWTRSSRSSPSRSSWTRSSRSYIKDFVGGAKDMWKNYKDLKASKNPKADKYFHAKANYEAASRGPGGKDAAKVFSNAKEYADLAIGKIKSLVNKAKWNEVVKDSKADQEANKWGRNGGDPNKYRPDDLDDKYRK